MKYLFTILFFLINISLLATTYYISPSGSDAIGTGTSLNPWRSLYKACNSVRTSGSIIHVNAGNYTEPNQCNLSLGVSIEGVGETSNIICTYVGKNDKDFAISLVSSTDIAGEQSISYVKIDGSSLTATNGIMVMCRSNVSIHHCTIVDFHYCGVYFLGADGYSTGNNFYNNRVTNCSTRKAELAGCGLGLLQLGSQSTMNIYNNTFDQTQREPGENGNCIFGIAGHLANIKIHDNTFHKPDDEGEEWNFHIEVFYVDGGIEVYNNTFNGGGQLIDCGHQAVKGDYDYSWWIHDNLFEMDAQLAKRPSRIPTGVDLEMDTEYAIIENNHFRNLGLGIELNLRAEDSSKGMNNITIRNNFFENMGYGDESWDAIVYLIGYESSTITFNNIYIYHNTITSLATGGGNPAMCFYLESSGVVQNVYIRNNIIRDVSNYGYLVFRETAAVEGGPITGDISNIYSEYNVLYNNVNNNVPYYFSGTTVPNFVTNNNIVSDPLLVSTSDFHLATGSPCKNAGLNVGVLKDKDGVLRNNPPSIGAFE